MKRDRLHRKKQIIARRKQVFLKSIQQARADIRAGRTKPMSELFK